MVALGPTLAKLGERRFEDDQAYFMAWTSKAVFAPSLPGSLLTAVVIRGTVKLDIARPRIGASRG
jgi:hypothetical protein